MPPRASPVVPPTVRGLAVVSLFNDFASEMIYPLLPTFVATTLGGGAVALGILDGAADLTAAVVKWFSGRLADRPGWRRPMILLGYLSAVLVRPLISVAGAAWQVIGFRVIDRIGKGVRTPPRDALIADVTPLAARGRAFGFHRAADHFGAVLGSLAAWAFLRAGTDVRRVIEWSLAPGLVAFVILWVVLRPAAARAEPTPAPSAQPAQAPPDAAGRVFWIPVLALAGLALARLPETLILLRLQDLGIPLLAIPLLWAALHVVRSGSSYPGGSLTDRIGSRWMIAGGGVLFALVAALLGLSLTPVAAGAVFLLFGVVAGLTEAAERAMVARLSPRRTGRAFGAYHALVGMAALPAGLLFGEVYDQLGGHWAFWLSALAALGAVIVWLATARAE